MYCVVHNGKGIGTSLGAVIRLLFFLFYFQLNSTCVANSHRRHAVCRHTTYEHTHCTIRWSKSRSRNQIRSIGIDDWVKNGIKTIAEPSGVSQSLAKGTKQDGVRLTVNEGFGMAKKSIPMMEAMSSHREQFDAEIAIQIFEHHQFCIYSQMFHNAFSKRMADWSNACGNGESPTRPLWIPNFWRISMIVTTDKHIAVVVHRSRKTEIFLFWRIRKCYWSSSISLNTLICQHECEPSYFMATKFANGLRGRTLKCTAVSTTFGRMWCASNAIAIECRGTCARHMSFSRKTFHNASIEFVEQPAKYKIDARCRRECCNPINGF